MFRNHLIICSANPTCTKIILTHGGAFLNQKCAKCCCNIFLTHFDNHYPFRYFFCTFLFKNYPPPTWDDVFACAVMCCDINPPRNFRFYAKLTELRNRIKNNTSTTGTGNTTTTNITNSTVPAAALRSLSTSKPLSNTITSLTSSNNNNESQQLSSVAEVSSHDSLSPNEDTSLSSTTSSTNSSDASWSASR